MNAPQTATEPLRATQSVYGGHDGIPTIGAAKAPRRVTFTAGNDPTQMMAAWLNWRRWGLEEHDVEMNTAGFVNEWLTKANSGNFVQLIGWDDDDEPVAMVELMAVHDALLDRTTLWGDHAFVRKDYRKKGVMTELVAFCIDIANVMGIKHWMVPVTAGAEATAPWLRKVYEDAGFKVTGITMTRKA